MVPNRKIPKKFTKKFDNKVINRLGFSFSLIYNLEAVVAQLKKNHGVGIGPLSKILAVKAADPKVAGS